MTEGRSTNIAEGAAAAVAIDLTAESDDERTPQKKPRNPARAAGGGKESDDVGGYETPSAPSAGGDPCTICLSPIVRAGARSSYKISKCQVCVVN